MLGYRSRLADLAVAIWASYCNWLALISGRRVNNSAGKPAGIGSLRSGKSASNVKSVLGY